MFLRRNYNITTLEKHLNLERVDKEKLLNSLNELSDEVFTFMHQHGIQGMKHDHKEDVMWQQLQLSQEMVANSQAQTNSLIGMIMHELQNQQLQWKCQALKVIVEDAKLAKYDYFFKDVPS